MVAAPMLGVMEGMIRDLESAGVTPMVSLATLRMQYLATADMLLPQRLRLTPPVASAVGTTAVIVQRWKHREAIAAASTASAAVGGPHTPSVVSPAIQPAAQTSTPVATPPSQSTGPLSTSNAPVDPISPGVSPSATYTVADGQELVF